MAQFGLMNGTKLLNRTFATEADAKAWGEWNAKGRGAYVVVPIAQSDKTSEKTKVRFEIECGGVREIIEANTPHNAWMLFNGPANAGSALARFREVPWNSVYTWTIYGKRGRRWCYVAPDWFLSSEAHRTTQSEFFAAGDLKNP